MWLDSLIMRPGLIVTLLFLLLIPLGCGIVVEIDCVDDLDCPIGSLCIDNFCQGEEECVLDSDCPDPGGICADGICIDAFLR